MEWGGNVLTVTFNGIELTRWILVKSGFTALGGADYEVELQENTARDGSEVMEIRRGIKKIPMPFFVRYDTIEEYDNLQKALSVSEPAELRFSHLPDRVFFAVPSGDLDFDEIKMNGSGTISWIVPSGRAVARKTTTISLNIGENTITNTGSAETYPVITIDHKSDNGWIGLVSPNGVLELGNRDSVDMDDKPIRTALIPNVSAFSSGRTTTIPTGDLAQGTLSVSGGKITLGQKGAWGDGKKWAGGYNVATIPATGAGAGTGDKRFYAHFQIAAETGKVSQTGLLKILFLDAKNNIIAMYDVHKGRTNINEVDFIMWYGGNSLKKYKSFTFTSSNKERENPFRSKTHGSVDFEKIGGNLRFFYWGKHHSVKVPELAEVAIAKVGIFIGQYGTRDLIADHFFSVLQVKSFFAEITNLDKQRGVKNVFLVGDSVKIDMASGEVTVNDMERNDLVVTGSDFFEITPGSNKIDLQVSSFSKAPPISKLEIREEFL